MFKETAEGTILSLHVQPNAPQSKIIGEYNGSLKIKIHAPPVDGKANEEIIRFLAKILEIPKARIEILKGETFKLKKVLIRGLEEAAVRSLIDL